MKSRILVVSSANMDFVQRMSRIPKAGETVVESESYSYLPGGKGANSAVAFAKIGADTVLCARVGNDPNGRKLKQLYEKENIDTRFIVSDKSSPTGLASILVEENGSNRIIVYPGANANLSGEDVEEAFTCYPDGVYVQFEIPNEPVLTAARIAYEKNIPLFVDAGPARADFPLEDMKRIEILSPNETETYALTGIEPTTVENCLRACIRLTATVDIKHVVLKLGSRGCFVYDGKYHYIYPSHKVEAVDTTAAGDVFTAALSYAYMQNNHDICAAARFANLAGALSVTKEGAIPSIPSIAQIKRFAEEIKERKNK